MLSPDVVPVKTPPWGSITIGAAHAPVATVVLVVDEVVVVVVSTTPGGAIVRLKAPALAE